MLAQGFIGSGPELLLLLIWALAKQAAWLL